MKMWGFAVLLLATGSLQAQPSVEVQSLFQARKNAIDEREGPWLNRFLLDGPVDALHLRFQADGQFESDIIQDSTEADLYQASLQWADPSLGLSAQAGRFLTSSGEAVFAMDGAELSAGRGKRVSGRFFGGSRRHLEISDFKEQSILVGVDGRIDPLSITTITAGYRLEDDRDGVSRHWVVGAFRQAVPVLFTPVLYGSMDYQLDEKTLAAFRAGLELHPLKKLQLSGEILRFDESDDGFEWSDSIYRLFAQGPQWQSRLALALTPHRDWRVRGSYSHVTYDVLAGSLVKGDQAGIGATWTQRHRRPWTVALDGVLEDSYGGRVWLGLASIEKQISMGWRARANGTAATYHKVTGSNDFALHSGLGLLYQWSWGLELGFQGEMNSNIDQPRDYRAGMVARYVYF